MDSFSNFTGALKLDNTGLTTDTPKYEYVAAPYAPANVLSIKSSTMGLTGGPIQAHGINIANSQWLQCDFSLPDIVNGSLLLDAKTASSVASVIQEEQAEPCPTSGTCVSMSRRLGLSTTKASCAALPVVGPAFVNATLRNSDTHPLKFDKEYQLKHKERVLELEGDQVVNVDYLTGASANQGQHLFLTCQENSRFSEIVFAVYGTPPECASSIFPQCDGSNVTIPCDYEAILDTNIDALACNSDTENDIGFTRGIVELQCLGKSSCVVPATSLLFSDPCPSRSKRLTVVGRCTDQYLAKDFVQVLFMLDFYAQFRCYINRLLFFLPRSGGSDAVL